MNKTIELIYTANAGLLIKSDHKSLLIDGLARAENLLYSDTPWDLASKMISGEPPFHHVDAMLYTHAHPDHFSAELTADFLTEHPETQLVCGHAVLERLQTYSDAKTEAFLSRCHAFTEDRPRPITKSDIEILPIKTLHMGPEFKHVEHYSFLIEMDGVNILIIGDAELTPKNFIDVDYENHPIDLVIAPFPYLSTFRGQKVIREVIKPHQMAVIHLPTPEKDAENWRESTLKMHERTKERFVPTVLIDKLGHEYKINF